MKKVLKAIRRPQLLIALLLVAAVGSAAYFSRDEVSPLSSSANSLSGIVGPQTTCDYYADPAGTSTGDGSSVSPWDLQTALNKSAQITAGKTLCLKGGTYNSKYTSSLNGGTVRSAPGEWAKIDGFKSTTLTADISASAITLPVADVAGWPGTNQLFELGVENEVIRIYGRQGNNLTVYDRAASGSTSGAVAHSAGTIVTLAGDNLYIGGSNTIYRDMEVMNSDPVRDAAVNTTRNWGRGGVAVIGSGNKIINMVVHDGLSGIFTGSSSSNTELYGNIIYNSGGVDLDGGGSGHGMYLENSSGYSKIYNNIVYNSYNLGMQAFGQTGPYIGGDFQDNAWANSGAPLGWTRNRNAVYGTNTQLIPSINLERNHYYHQPETNGYGLIVGYGAGVSNANFSGNYVVAANNAAMVVENTQNLTGSGNHFYGQNVSFASYLQLASYGSFSWNNNTYHKAGSSEVLAAVGTGVYNFTNWKSITGLDSNSTATSVAMPNTVIIVPNIYQSGRATVYIYNTAGGSTANIDLSRTGLTDGQSYEIRSAQNYTGTVVASGTYSSANSTISVSLSGAAATVIQPIGGSSTVTTTCPNFCPMVVLPTSGVVTPPSDTTPPVLSNGSPSGAQPAGTTSTTLSVSTNETATCKYGTTPNTPYASLPSTFSNSNSTSHTTNISGLASGNSYNYYVRCQDTASNVTTSDYTISFNVAVASDTTAPTVSMTAPAVGSTVSGGTVAVSATASDNIGVVGVQFKLDGSNLGAEDTSSPYSFLWNTLAVTNGTHTLTAVARDAANNSATSSSVSVTVNNVTVPSVVATPSITPNGGTYSTTQSVTLASATSGATIRYTADGSNPTATTGTVYSSAISVAATTTLKAIAYKSGLQDSSVASATFTITTPPTTGPAPQIISFGLSAKTGTSATLTWKTNIPSTGSISYGTIKSSLTKTIAETDPATCTSTSCTHTASIANLTRNTNYYYIITATNNGASTSTIRSSFRTSR